MPKFVVITGLDGSGTSTIGRELNRQDRDSCLLQMPGRFLPARGKIDHLRESDCAAHYFFYLAATISASRFIAEQLEQGRNVYCVRYLIDTVVSHRALGLPVELEYNTGIYGIQPPDLTVFLCVEEPIRQRRLDQRGRSYLDKTLDNVDFRERFLAEFRRLASHFSEVDNTTRDIKDTALEIKTLLNP